MIFFFQWSESSKSMQNLVFYDQTVAPSRVTRLNMLHQNTELLSVLGCTGCFKKMYSILNLNFD